MDIGTNKFLTGSNGYLWFNGELMANLKKVDIKVEGQFDDVTVSGDYATYQQYKGYKVSGSLTFAKVNSSVVAKYAAAYKTGVMPDTKIVSKLRDVNTGESERVAITGVVLTTLPLIVWDAQNLIDEEFPVSASGYEMLEEIA